MSSLVRAPLGWVLPVRKFRDKHKTAVCRRQEERGGKSEVRKGSEVLPALQIAGPVGGATRHGAARGARPSSSSLRGSLGRPCADSDRAGTAARRAPPCLPAAAGDPRAPAASVVFGLGFLFKALPKWPPRTHFAQGGNHALLFQ